MTRLPQIPAIGFWGVLIVVFLTFSLTAINFISLQAEMCYAEILAFPGTDQGGLMISQ